MLRYSFWKRTGVIKRTNLLVTHATSFTLWLCWLTWDALNQSSFGFSDSGALWSWLFSRLWVHQTGLLLYLKGPYRWLCSMVPDLWITGLWIAGHISDLTSFLSAIQNAVVLTDRCKQQSQPELCLKNRDHILLHQIQKNSARNNGHNNGFKTRLRLQFSHFYIR